MPVLVGLLVVFPLPFPVGLVPVTGVDGVGVGGEGGGGGSW